MSTYMKVNGDNNFNGNVTASGLEKHIQLMSANFGVTRKMNTQPGAVSDREGTKPSVREFTVTKEVDATSPYFARDAAAGTTIPSIEIKFVNTGKDLSIYHVVKLENVLISGYDLQHDEANFADKSQAAEAKPKEVITFNFTKFEVTNTPYSKDHKAGSPITAGYDLETAKPL